MNKTFCVKYSEYGLGEIRNYQMIKTEKEIVEKYFFTAEAKSDKEIVRGDNPICSTGLLSVKIDKCGISIVRF